MAKRRTKRKNLRIPHEVKKYDLPPERPPILPGLRRGAPTDRGEAYRLFLMHEMSRKGRPTGAVDPRLTGEWEALEVKEILFGLEPDLECVPKALQGPIYTREEQKALDRSFRSEGEEPEE